jgi:hypothetical protein
MSCSATLQFGGHCIAIRDATLCLWVSRTYSEPELRSPLFFASPHRGHSRFSAGMAIAFADNFLQKQQKQPECRFGEVRLGESRKATARRQGCCA